MSSRVIIVFGETNQFCVTGDVNNRARAAEDNEDYLILLEDKQYENEVNEHDEDEVNEHADICLPNEINTAYLYLHNSSDNHWPSQIKLAKRLLNTKNDKLDLERCIFYFSHINRDRNFQKLKSIILCDDIYKLSELFQELDNAHLVKLVDKFAVELILNELEPDIIRKDQIQSSATKLSCIIQPNLVVFNDMSPAEKLSTLAASCKSLLDSS